MAAHRAVVAAVAVAAAGRGRLIFLGQVIHHIEPGHALAPIVVYRGRNARGRLEARGYTGCPKFSGIGVAYLNGKVASKAAQW